MENDKNLPIEAFAGTAWEVGLVQSLLENAEIQTFLKDEINGTLVPWVIASGGAGSIKIIVSNLDYNKAKMIVDEYGSLADFAKRQPLFSEFLLSSLPFIPAFLK